jgi:hypothetical protein
MSTSPNNPSKRNEDEYFTRQDAELIRSMRDRLDSERSTADKPESYMKCPRCGGTLVEVAHGDVKIDQCDSCTGVWLDPGEIELIERASRSSSPQFMENLFGMLKRPSK